MFNKITSKKIFSLIFSNLKSTKKLKTVKYNKKIQDKLNIDIKDFEIYALLKEFNTKYNLNIEERNIDTLKINNIGSGKELFDYLNKLKFTELKELIISESKNLDLKLFERIKFNRLEKLVLERNHLKI